MERLSSVQLGGGAVRDAEPLWSLVQSGEAIGNFAAGAFAAQERVRVLPDEVSYPVHLWVLLSRAAMATPRVRQIHRAMQQISKEVSSERRADDD